MSSLDPDLPAAKFETKKEFLEFLYELMISSFEKTESTLGETRGRPRFLKTNVLEANQGLPEQTDGLGVLVRKESTALPEIDILTLEHNNIRSKFYVDTSDRRFWLLHTNALSEYARKLFDRLVFSPKRARYSGSFVNNP